MLSVTMKTPVVAVLLSCVCGFIVAAPAPDGFNVAQYRRPPFIVQTSPIYNDDTFSHFTPGGRVFSKPGTYVKPISPFQRIPEGYYPGGGLTLDELEMLYPQENRYSKEAPPPLPDLPRFEDKKHEYDKMMKAMEALLRILEQPNHQTSGQRERNSEVDDTKQKIEDENIPHILIV